MEEDLPKELGDKSRSVGIAIRDVTVAMSEAVRSEVRLAKAEMKDTGAKLGRQAIRVGLCAGFIVLGVLPLLAFFVIGVGNLLGGNYWLSSLIFAAFFLTIGAILAYRIYEKGRTEDYLFPEMRTTLSNEAEELKRRIRQFPGGDQKRKAG